MKAHITRAAAATRGPALSTALTAALTAALLTGCATATEKGKEIASSASSIGSSAASAAGSAASSAASAAESAASSAGSIASSAVSSVLDGKPVLEKPMTIDAPGIGAVTLDGPAAAVYEKAGGAATLGTPTAAPQTVTGTAGGGEGTVYTFTAGSIFESPKHGPKLLRGEILRIYNANGGPGGALGWPVADETETAGGPGVTNGGWIGEFENGTISWLNDGNGSFGETVAVK